jgi:hypothetical protein
MSPEEYSSWMQKREDTFGHKDLKPIGEIEHFFPGTFYLTEIDKVYRRFYKIKDASEEDKRQELTFNWTGELKPYQTALKRLSLLDSQFTATGHEGEDAVMR